MKYVAWYFVVACGGQDAPVVENPRPTAPTATTTATAAASATSEMQAMVDAQNRLRAAHCAPPLVWSTAVAEHAQKWADHLASRGCALQHSETEYGENISGGSLSTQTPDQVASLWYRENAGYHYAPGGFSMTTGHFTQLVWRGSQRLGCGAASCGDLRVWVCNYDPAGNMQGDFNGNVLPTSCKR